MSSISVIIPHYNRPDVIGAAIQSVRTQTIEPLEIIVVDDCSRPEARQQLEQFSGIATIISLPRNVGLSAARNYGASKARGGLLAFLDDDDLFLPERLEKGLRYLQQHPECDAVGGGLTMVCGSRREYWGERVTRTVKLTESFLYTASMVQSLLVTADSFWKIGGFDARLRYLPDFELGIRFIGAGLRMDFVAEPFFLYNLRGSNQLSANWRANLLEQLLIVYRHRRLCREAFGPSGLARVSSFHCRRYGEMYGGVLGRSLWATGKLMQLATGEAYPSWNSAA